MEIIHGYLKKSILKRSVSQACKPVKSIDFILSSWPTFSIKDCMDKFFRLPLEPNDFRLLLSKQSLVPNFQSWLIQTD